MKRVLAWGAMVIGVWLIISPWFLNYQSASSQWGDTIAGIVIAALSLIAIFSKEKTPNLPYWISGVLGLWLIASGIWVFGVAAGASRWNEIVSGILLALLSFLATQLLEGFSMHMYTRDGAVLMEVSGLKQQGNDIAMQGKSFGTMPTTVYVHPEEAWAMLGMVPIEIVCSLPVFLVRGWWRSRKRINKS